jgi:hypothetical protein
MAHAKTHNDKATSIVTYGRRALERHEGNRANARLGLITRQLRAGPSRSHLSDTRNSSAVQKTGPTTLGILQDETSQLRGSAPQLRYDYRHKQFRLGAREPELPRTSRALFTNESDFTLESQPHRFSSDSRILKHLSRPLTAKPSAILTVAPNCILSSSPS